MTEAEFNRTLGAFFAQGNVEFTGMVDRMILLLDSADGDDYFGTEGWRHILGWDE